MLKYIKLNYERNDYMQYNLNELSYKDHIDIDEIVKKDDNLDSRILDLDANVSGKIFVNSANEIELSCEFKGIMYLEDSISLDKVPYNFSIAIDETLEDLEENYSVSVQKNKNILDLKDILWQNIVLEVPISYTKVIDANLKGNGWELIDSPKTVGVDPRLKELEDLLKGDD